LHTIFLRQHSFQNLCSYLKYGQTIKLHCTDKFCICWTNSNLLELPAGKYNIHIYNFYMSYDGKKNFCYCSIFILKFFKHWDILTLETQLNCKNVSKRETPRWLPIEVIVLVKLTTLTFGWRKCQNSHQNNSSLSHTHNFKISWLPTKIDECLPIWRRKNWPQNVSRLRTRVGSPDTVYRSVSSWATNFKLWIQTFLIYLSFKSRISGFLAMDHYCRLMCGFLNYCRIKTWIFKTAGG
jgi:hypothetical protein